MPDTPEEAASKLLDELVATFHDTHVVTEKRSAACLWMARVPDKSVRGRLVCLLLEMEAGVWKAHWEHLAEPRRHVSVREPIAVRWDRDEGVFQGDDGADARGVLEAWIRGRME